MLSGICNKTLSPDSMQFQWMQNTPEAPTHAHAQRRFAPEWGFVWAPMGRRQAGLPVYLLAEILGEILGEIHGDVVGDIVGVVLDGIHQVMQTSTAA